MQSWEINKEQSNEITTLRNQLAEAREIIENTDMRLHVESENVKRLGYDVTSKEESIIKQQNEITTLRQQLAEAQAKVKELEGKEIVIGSNVQKLGARLTFMLDDDQWNNIQQLLEAVNEEIADLTAQLEAAKVQGEPVAWAIHVEGDTDSEITLDSIWDHPQFANDHINQQYELQADGYLPKCKRSVVPLYTHPAPSTEKVK